MDKDYGLVSVIIPVYNSEKYLHRCVDSILAQTYKNIEVILVDDGTLPPDRSSQICDEYAEKDSRVKAIHQKNGGVSVARNHGLTVSLGDYIYFVDSDDYIDKDLIKDNLSLLIANEADIVCFNDINNSNVRYNKNMDTMDIIKNIYMGRLPGCVWDKLYKKEVWNNVRFPIGQNIAEDVYVTAHLLKNSRTIIATDKAYYYYTNNEGSLMHTQPMNTYLQKFYGVLERANIAKGLWSDLYIYSMNECFKYAFKCYQYNIILDFLNNKEKDILHDFFVKNKEFFDYLDWERKLYLFSYLNFKPLHYLKGFEYFLKYLLRK